MAAAPTIPAAVRRERGLLRADEPGGGALRADGTVFVAEKRGVVKRYSGLGDPTPETVADVRAAVHDYWDRA